MEKPVRTLGVLGQFDSPVALLSAARGVRDAGYKAFDCHSPFAIHGMDEAMGMRRSGLGWVVGAAAICGVGGGFGLQWWASTIAYPFVISGKPFNSFQAFVPITFGVGVLISATVTVLGMFHFNRLPRLHHPVFFSDTFRQASNDGFFISIEAEDKKFNEQTAMDLLRSLGAKHVEALRG